MSRADSSEAVDLTDLVRDPSRVANVAREQIPALLTQLSAVQASMAARLVTVSSEDRASNSEDTLLDIADAANRLGVSEDWLYRRTKVLPFVVRVGRHVRFSANGIDRFIRNRMGAR